MGIDEGPVQAIGITPEPPGTAGLTDAQSDARTSRIFATKEILDRLGYGASTPQVVNVLFMLAFVAHPFGLFFIGVLTGARTLISVIWSGILQEYSRLAMVRRTWVSAGGFVFGFMFLLMSLALLMRSLTLFSVAFLGSAVGIVAYGDLYAQFVQENLRRERRGAFLRGIATWGVLITAVMLLISGYLLDHFPSFGAPTIVTVFGKQWPLYGHLLAFEITAFAFILSGYVASFIADRRHGEPYQFGKFLREYWAILRSKMPVLFHNRAISLLTISGAILSVIQTIITAYIGIAIYRDVLQPRYGAGSFFALATILGIAVIASFTGPFFTRITHRTTGLAPTLVFGTLLIAILPIVTLVNGLVEVHIAAITAALCCNLIGNAIVGFGQGLLAQRLLSDERRQDYFRVQWIAIIVPYLILIPLFALVANNWSIDALFEICIAALIIVITPIYLMLVVHSEKRGF